MSTVTATPVVNEKKSSTIAEQIIAEKSVIELKEPLTDAQMLIVKKHLGTFGRENLNKVFAYQMKENIALYGAVKTEALFGTWMIAYIAKHLENDAKQLTKRIDDKKLLAEAKERANASKSIS